LRSRRRHTVSIKATVRRDADREVSDVNVKLRQDTNAHRAIPFRLGDQDFSGIRAKPA
jgi:hypothetical protein